MHIFSTLISYVVLYGALVVRLFERIKGKLLADCAIYVANYNNFLFNCNTIDIFETKLSW